MLRKTYDWAMRMAGSRHAPAGLLAVSFAESPFFPVPPDAMLAPMVLARPDRAYFYATVCTIASTSPPTETSARTNEAVPPRSSIMRTVTSPDSVSMSEQATVAPSRAKTNAVARPIPEPAPVTRAIFWSKSPMEISRRES